MRALSERVEREGEAGFEAVSGMWTLSTAIPGFSGAGYVVNRSNAKGDRLRWTLPEYLPAGSYRVLLRTIADPNAGALIFNVDKAKPVKVDLYRPTWERVWTEHDLFFNCPVPWHTIMLLVDEKNPKSGGNFIRVDSFFIDKIHPLQRYVKPAFWALAPIVTGLGVVRFGKKG